MSSLYVPLVLRLEVRDQTKIVQSFIDDSAAGSESPLAGERTLQRLVKKGVSPIKKDQKEEEPPIGEMLQTNELSHNYHKGRRTYSEVVIESLEGDKILETNSVAGTSEKSGGRSGSEAPPEKVPYYCGNPLTEKTEGIMHFYKYQDVKRTKAAQCRMLCMYAVPAQVEVREIISFMCISLPMIVSIKVVRDPTPNQYMLIIKFKEHNDAVTFYEEFNNCPFNDLESHCCTLFFVDRIECKTSDELLSASSEDESLIELPTCAVCLERMDDSVLAILCNHSFHARCLEQWADNTCPVCRYVQSPEVVAEQRCNDCGMSNDLWICLICGNIGCGRYAEQHAQRHWELTSHTYSLKVGGERVWDYAGDNYVHRLIENQADGKLVEVQRDANASIDEKSGKDDKLEGIKLEYTLLLTSQLEDQRKYFEGQKHDMEQTMSKMEKMAYAQVESLEHQLTERSTELKTLRGEMDETVAARKVAEKKAVQTNEKVAKLMHDLKDEKELNEMLRKDQQVWKQQVEKLIDTQKTARTEYEKKIDDLQSQVNDLLMHFETQNKLKEQLEAGTVTQEEITESQVGLDSSSSSSSSKKLQKRKKNKN